MTSSQTRILKEIDYYDFESEECRYSFDELFPHTTYNYGYTKVCNIEYLKLLGVY